MGTVEESAAAVRIELSNDDGTIVQSPVEPSGGANSSKTIAAVVIGVMIVAAMVWATRPDDGETAAGTPITVPTTVPEKTETSLHTDGPEDDAAGMAEESEYESVDANTFFLSIVQADLGWIAMGIDFDTVAPVLFRSIDGLNWTKFSEGSLPEGDLLGLDRFEDTYVIAVDEERTWSGRNRDFADGQYPDHRISVWTSVDAVTWIPSDLPVLEGNGYPYLLSFTRDSYVLPMIDSADEHSELLIGLLEPFLDAEQAELVCSSRRTFETEIRTVELIDCEGGLVAEVTEEQFPDEFENVWRDCVDVARSSGEQRFSSTLVERTGLSARLEQSGSGGLFSRAVPNGLLTRVQTPNGLGLPEECGGTLDPVPFDMGLLLWHPETGARDVSPTTPTAADSAFGFGNAIVRGTDDRYYVTMAGSVWAARSPFDEWEEVLVSPIDGSVGLPISPDSHLSLSADGRHAFQTVPGALYIAPLDGKWKEIPLVRPDGLDSRIGPGELIEIVVATEEYVVVREQGSRGQRLVKVPLS